MQNILVHQETDKFKVSWEMSQTVHQPSLGQTSPPHIRERIKDNKNAKIKKIKPTNKHQRPLRKELSSLSVSEMLKLIYQSDQILYYCKS